MEGDLSGEDDASKSLADGTLQESWSVLTKPGPDRDTVAKGHLWGGRYEDRGLVARGGMGEVRRAYDRELLRDVALKVLHPSLSAEGAEERLVAEAQTAAQLEHPGILPVYDAGADPNGRFFVMRHVQGRTMTALVREAHDDPASDWNVRRLVGTVASVCDALAYAHSRGVLHLDLKPDNVMVGAFGEVFVLDWGLSRLRTALAQAIPVVMQHRAYAPDSGVEGTMAYMAPEQAAGRVDEADKRTDVYALGAILYQVVQGNRPYWPLSGATLWARVRQGPPDPLPDDTADAALAEVISRAMALAPADRFEDGLELASALRDWSDGTARRQLAARMMDRLKPDLTALAALRIASAGVADEAEVEARRLESWRPPEEKQAVWTLERQADELEREVQALDIEVEGQLRQVLAQDDDNPDAHQAIAALAAARVDAEEALGRTGNPRDLAVVRDHDRAGNYADWLTGTGALTLLTDPPGATVEVWAYEPEGKRLVANKRGEAGKTPLHQVPLDPGSYLLVLRHPDCEPVRYPVYIDRQQHWDGVRPGDDEPTPLRLPPAGSLLADEIYVPAGWFWSGGDTRAVDDLRRKRLWCDPFIIERFQCTTASYIAFLDGLLAEGKDDEAARRAMRFQYGTDDKDFDSPIHREGDHYVLSKPDEPRTLQLQHPAVMLRLIDARFWAEHADPGRGWRLPDELEWEKAAKGVDGRHFPWGPLSDPTYANTVDARPPDDPLHGIISPIDAFETDESPYGVRGMAGNTTDYTSTAFSSDGDSIVDGLVDWRAGDHPSKFYVRRGGLWRSAAITMRLGMRWRRGETDVDTLTSFRRVRSVGSEGW